MAERGVTLDVDLLQILQGVGTGGRHRRGVQRLNYVTADLQIVEPGLEKDVNSAGRIQNVGTAVVGGLRVFTRF